MSYVQGQPGMSADEMRKLQQDLAEEKKAREAADEKKKQDDAEKAKLLAEVAELRRNH